MSNETQSTTQNNDDRSSCGHFGILGPSVTSPDGPDDESPLASTAPIHSSPRVLPEDDDDDSGGVLFLLNQTEGVETQTSQSDAATRAARDFGSQPATGKVESQARLHSTATTMLPPETPANANPFAGRGQGALLPGSEMFMHTQFSAVPRVGLSPTSSRPSPDVFAHNFISPNFINGSPLQARGNRFAALDQTSSPCMPTEHPSRPIDDLEDTMPVGHGLLEYGDIPESPTTGSRASCSPPDPDRCYEPMQHSQKRREQSAPKAGQKSDNDWSDDEVPLELVKSRRNAAVRGLRSATLDPKGPKGSKGSNDEEVEVPSTEKKRPRTSADEKIYISRHHGKNPCGKQNTQEISVLDPADNAWGSQEQDCRLADPSSRDAIPETSPPGSRSRYPAQSSNSQPLVRQIASQQASQSAITETPSFPSTRPRPTTHSGATTPPLLESSASDTGATTRFKRRRLQEPMPRPPASSPVPEDSHDAVPTRQHSEQPDVSPLPHASSGVTVELASSMSDLSNLGTTPGQSNETTPATADSPTRDWDKAAYVVESSPVDAKTRRRGVNKTYSKKLRNSSRLQPPIRNSTRQSSASSTDELARSPVPAPVPDHNLRTSRSGRASHATAIPYVKATASIYVNDAKIFEGMVFAISFSNRKASEGVEYNGHVEHVSTIQKKIRQGGGRVLDSGFDELFETMPIETASPHLEGGLGNRPVPELSITAASLSTGFAALIADSHHRKSKYMQALALGLPCLSARWVVACSRKGEIVDWEPYLLCAGQSMFLGDAFRSRNLVPYDAVTAQLREVVKKRPRLLAGSNILLVMRKSEEVKKMAYVFLVRALGASLSRVFTVDEAREVLRAAEGQGTPFDWVYLDENSAKDQLFMEQRPATPTPIFPLLNKGKKRKRAAAAASLPPPGPPPKKIRTLSNELVVQSLILGRLIEAEEMEE